jgi:hypothetical protein
MDMVSLRMLVDMREVIVATPLKHYVVSHPDTFADGVSIRELAPIRWDISIAASGVSQRERDALAETKYWLCVAKEYDDGYTATGDELYPLAHDAALALQIICPTGAMHRF